MVSGPRLFSEVGGTFPSGSDDVLSTQGENPSPHSNKRHKVEEESPVKKTLLEDQPQAVTPSPTKTGRWTKREDEQLRATVERFEQANQTKDWKLIAKVAFNGARSDTQCLERWERVLKLGLVKGPWTPEEDDVVRRAVDQSRRRNGGVDCNWAEVAKLLPGRLTKQVRERWQNHLNPALVKSPWTEEEDYLLVSLQAVLGNRWNEIARAFQGRSENAIKNRWNSKQRRTLVSNGSSNTLATNNTASTTTSQLQTSTSSTSLVAQAVVKNNSENPLSSSVESLGNPSDQSTDSRPPSLVRNVCRNINFHKALVKASGNDPEINEAAAILVNKVSRSVAVQ